jgi:hypothetical protein
MTTMTATISHANGALVRRSPGKNDQAQNHREQGDSPVQQAKHCLARAGRQGRCEQVGNRRLQVDSPAQQVVFSRPAIRRGRHKLTLTRGVRSLGLTASNR